MAQPGQASAQAVISPELGPYPVPPSPGFEDFYRSAWRELIPAAVMAGATKEEAEDAASKTLLDMLRIWPVPGHPLTYARKATVHNFIKEKTRGNQRAMRRLIQRGHVSPREGTEDPRLTDLETREWVTHLLSKLPTAQREVMACVIDGLSYEEIAGAFGKSRDAVRRNLSDARATLVKLLHADREDTRQAIPRNPLPGRRPDDPHQLQHHP